MITVVDVSLRRDFRVVTLLLAACVEMLLEGGEGGYDGTVDEQTTHLLSIDRTIRSLCEISRRVGLIRGQEETEDQD